MTAYELMDLRKNYISELSISFRFWVTITFAALVAAETAGDAMGTLGMFAGAVLYLTMTGVSIASVRRLASTLQKVVLDQKKEKNRYNGEQARVMKDIWSIIALHYPLAINSRYISE